MKTLYLDCGMGAAGDMLTAALLELLPEPDRFIARLNALGIPGVRVCRERAEKCGITGTHVSVTVNGSEEHEHLHEPRAVHMHLHDHEHLHAHPHDHVHIHNHDHHHSHEHFHNYNSDHSHDHGHVHDHHHGSLHEIEHIVRDHLPLPENVRENILAVYRLLAEAESHVHGVPVPDIHFHEVGTMDALADITAVCLLMDQIAPDEVIASPVHVGCGHVRCAHGILPVPAPAAAYILQGIPTYGGQIQGELCTPTGAALLKYFVTRFDAMPVMKTHAIGYGMGKKDFETANCVRAMLGETTGSVEHVIELSCNIDDMTAEAISFAAERLLAEGALDVYTIPIGMKKTRPGTLLRVMCSEAERERILGLIFRHTSTIGIRESIMRRYILDREIKTVQTVYGDVRCKISSGYGVKRCKYEYEDLARIAREQNRSLEEVMASLRDPD